MHTMPWMVTGPTAIDFQPTDDPKTIEKLQRDPLMLRQVRFDMGDGLMDLMDAACDSATRIHEPYMLLHGLGDKIVPDKPIRTVIETMPPRADSKLAFYKEGYHLLLRDKQGPKVSADVVAWIADHDAALPSGDEAQHTQPKIAASWGSKRITEQTEVGRGG
jgi:alpha-beta hydrolase superfamily lysophospholipase